MKLLSKSKKNKRTKLLVSDIRKASNKDKSNVIILRKNDLKIQINVSNLIKKIGKKNIVLYLLAGVFIFFIIKSFILPTKAEIYKFYPTSCLGGWQNASNAQGVPDLDENASPSSFNKNNSAYISNAISQIYCGNFKGSNPDTNLQIKRAYLTFSWLVLSQEEEQSLISSSSFIQEVTTGNSSTLQVIDPISNSVSNTTTETSTENNTTIQTSTDNSAVTQTETQIQTPTQTSTETQAQTSTENSVVTSTEIQTTTQTQIQTTNQTTNQTTTQTPTETSTENTTTSQNQIPQPQETQAAGSQQNSTSSSESVPIINFLYKLLFSKVFAEENLTSTLEIQEQSTTNQNIVDSSNTTSTLNNESANSQNQTSSLESTSTQESTSTNNENLNQDNNQIQMPQDAFLEVLYTLDGQNWKHLGFVTKSNWKNLELDIPDVNFNNLSNLQISLKSIVSDFTPTIYLDGMILNIEYENSQSLSKINPEEQKQNAPLVTTLGTNGTIIQNQTTTQEEISDKISDNTNQTTTLNETTTPVIYEPLKVRKIERKIEIKNIDNLSCSGDQFVININEEETKFINLKFSNKEMKRLEIGSLPAGIDIVFAQNNDYEIYTNNETVGLKIYRQKGSEKGNFSLPIILNSKSSTIVCQINVITN